MRRLLTSYVTPAILSAIGLTLVIAAVFPIEVVAMAQRPSAAGAENIFKVLFPTGQQAGGTGFLLNHKDYGKLVITNRHVCEALDESNNFHILEQGDKVYVAITRIKSELTDLCIIKPPQEVIESRAGLKLAERDAREGEAVYVEGHPFLKPLTRYNGRLVNVIVQPLDLTEVVPSKFIRMGRVDFMVFPGNSGSPVFNKAGEVIGVVFAMEGSTQNGLYIPLLDLKYFLMQAGSSL